MIKKTSKTTLSAILIFVSVVLSGCSNSSEPQTAKNASANQAQTNTSNNGGNSVPFNAPSAPTPVADNNSAAAPTGSKSNKPAATAKEPTPQIGSGGDDMFLFTQIRGALGGDKELSSVVIVELKEGNVTLNGGVSSQAQKEKAAQLVQAVKGVKSVKNNLRVSQ